ncbi:MAG: carbohydrate kinase family protein [Spirochaetales bacterium]|nr:carbohydrate kinase family protein [Spirochaetales bacterium]
MREDIFTRLEKGAGKEALFIGGFNQDIQMKPASRLIQGDSVPGTVLKTPGGVVRNIGENCSLLGLDSFILSLRGDDEAGREIVRLSELSGLSCAACDIIPGAATSTYSALLDENGRMLYAVNQMDLMEKIDTIFLRERKSLISSAKAIVLDANLPAESLEYLCSEYRDTITLIDPVSTIKFAKLKGRLKGVKNLKPNTMEAESYTGITLEGESDYYRACEFFMNEGVESVYISAGKSGIYFMDSSSGSHGHIPPVPVTPQSVTGAGDAASAALVFSWLSGLSSSESAWLANLAAAASLLSPRAINTELTAGFLKQLSKEYSYEKFLS